MGNVHCIAKTNDFWIKNLITFKEELKGYIGGENETPVSYNYEDYKRRSKKALMNMSSEDFSEQVYKNPKDNEGMNLLEFIQSHIVEGETCVIHLVSYEHANDMMITKYSITSHSIDEISILD